MSRVKVKLQDTTPARIIWLDPDATKGATLGTNVYTPNGVVGTPTTVKEWLGLTDGVIKRVAASAGVTAHRLLTGLTLGNDHPQYPLKAGRETISGQWDFTQPIWMENGTAALPALTFTADPNTGIYRIGADNMGITTGGALHWDINTTRTYQDVYAHIRNYAGVFIENPDYLNAGIDMTTITGLDPHNNGIGNQIALWEVGTGGAFTDRSYGFRIRHAGEVNTEGNLDWYRHSNDTVGVLFLRFRRNSSQIFGADGTASEPLYSFFNDDDSGMYLSADGVAFARNGSRYLWLDNGFVASTFPIRAGSGTNATPGLSFQADPDTGMYRSSSANVLTFATGGTDRLSIGNTDTAGSGDTRGVRSTLSFRGPDGSATVPAFTFTGDDNTGYYRVGTDQLGVSTGGTLRGTWTTAALVLTVPVSAADGGNAAPSFAFTNDLDTGMYRIGTDILGFATAGVERLRISAVGAWGLAGANYGTASQVLTSNGSLVPPTWQDAGSGAVVSLVEGHGIRIDDYDASHPIVSVDQATDYIWAGTHTFALNGGFIISSSGASIRQVESDQASGGQRWTTRLVSGEWQVAAQADDGSASRVAFAAQRGAASSAITTVTLGNSTDVPDLSLLITDLSINGSSGTTGQVLTSNGVNVAPTWQTPSAAASNVDLQIFTSGSGNWTKPTGATWVEVICIGGGGGGGSGRKGAASSTRPGGSGGGGGGYSRCAIQASDLGATVAYVVGAFGAKGAAVTADSTNGNDGTAGGDSSFGTNIRALGGAKGQGGSGTTVAGGAGGSGIQCDGGAGGTGGTTTTGSSGVDSKYAGGGGAGGHGVSSANNVGGGLNIGGAVTLTNPALAGGTATAGAIGGNGNSTADAPTPGSGGGSGAGNGTGSSNGFNAGNGGSRGGGGGGGGGMTNGGANPSGAGGDGGAGVVVVITYK